MASTKPLSPQTSHKASSIGASLPQAQELEEVSLGAVVDEASNGHHGISTSASTTTVVPTSHSTPPFHHDTAKNVSSGGGHPASRNKNTTQQEVTARHDEMLKQMFIYYCDSEEFYDLKSSTRKYRLDTLRRAHQASERSGYCPRSDSLVFSWLWARLLRMHVARGYESGQGVKATADVKSYLDVVDIPAMVTDRYAKLPLCEVCDRDILPCNFGLPECEDCFNLEYEQCQKPNGSCKECGDPLQDYEKTYDLCTDCENPSLPPLGECADCGKHISDIYEICQDCADNLSEGQSEEEEAIHQRVAESLPLRDADGDVVMGSGQTADGGPECHDPQSGARQAVSSKETVEGKS
ncbi:Hypothetical predicted protein [Lecanosticta acicola]|uniref:Uncharacterized protein n=1 Tax=Lecanosticta acicola TaxID=111012 RepID=A0AAI8Z8U3_9PEZI|nr:Hypothetical predicted protein [Lecanosticta acicola]